MEFIKQMPFENWKKFYNFILENKIDLSKYIFRGQRQDWELESKIQRIFHTHGRGKYEEYLLEHKRKFKHESRGRMQKYRPTIFDNSELIDNELWAMGQHHGLATPLLDWTESIYFASYFAFIRNKQKYDKKNRVVFALHRGVNNIEMKKNLPYLRIVNPPTDENTRLIVQNGLFTKMLYHEEYFNLAIESFINKYLKVHNEDYIYKEELNENPLLFKFFIPTIHRNEALRNLKQMGIHHRSLFPDIEGSALFCNDMLEIDDY